MVHQNEVSSTLALQPTLPRVRTVILALVAVAFLPSFPSRAQMIRVDATPSHVLNSFSPLYALGSTVDRVPSNATDAFFAPAAIKQILSAGWGAISYRQNTELFIQAWHWNPKGTWSDPAGKGYFIGDSNPTEMIRHSFGYQLQHRGFTRNGGTEDVGYSRLNDGDTKTYWKSNPYLTKRFTGEEDAMHPQWVVIDLEKKQGVNAIRIDWAEPYARAYEVQYWDGTGDAMDEQASGDWKNFKSGAISNGKGGTSSRRGTRLGAIFSRAYDGILKYLRYARIQRSAQLRRLRDQRAVSGHDRRNRRVQRFDAPFRGFQANGDVLFFGRSLARTGGSSCGAGSHGIRRPAWL
jgi:F5/8 type C domain